MADLTIASAVVLCTREEVRDAIRQEIKATGIEAQDVYVTSNAKECLGRLQGMSTVILVIDWEVGPDQVFEVLRGTRGANKVETIPILLLAAQVGQHLFAVAAEYRISRVHVGEISRSNVRTEIRELLRETRNIGPIKQLMIKVEGLLRSGDSEGAKKILSQPKERAPDNPRVTLELAAVCVDLEQWDEASAHLVQLDQVDPPFARAKHLMARVLMKKGRLEEAIDYLKGAQLVNPYDVDRLLEMGQVLLDANRPQEAKEAFGDVLEFAPQSKAAKVGKGQSMLQLGEVDEALGFLKEATSGREMASIFNTAAILAIKRGEHDKAMGLYKAAASALGNQPRVMARLMFNMGIGYVKWRKPAKGVECFQKAAELDPSYADAKYNIEAMSPKKKGPPPAPTPGAPTAAPAEAFNELAGMDEQLGGGGLPNLELSFNTDFDDHFNEDDTLE